MGTIWVEGQFKNSAKPVKVVGGNIGGSGIDPDTLKNYATKAELQKSVEDLTASIEGIEGIDHNVEEETLIIQ